MRKGWFINVYALKGYAWSLSNCECECDKSFDVSDYLDDESCKCRKRLIDKLADERY